MSQKQLTILVAAVTAFVNVLLFLGGFTTTISCTVAHAINTAYAAVLEQ